MFVLQFEIEKYTNPFKTYVIRNLNYDVIIGKGFLAEYNGIIDFKENNLSLKINDGPYQLEQNATSENKSHQLDGRYQEILTTKRTFLKPFSTSILQVSYNFPTKSNYCFEPNSELYYQSNVYLQPTLVSGESNKITLLISNLSMEPQEQAKDTLLDNTYRIPSFKTPEDELGLSNLTLLLQNPKLIEKQIADITKLLLKHQAILAKSPDQLGRTHLIRHVTKTGDSATIRKRPYRVSPKQRKQIDEEMDEMLKTNIIRKSVTPLAAPVILVPKPNGEVRLCIDFKEVNSVTKKDSHPLPRIDDVLDSLNGSQYFTTLDLMSGLWQIEMEETSKEKTIFITH